MRRRLRLAFYLAAVAAVALGIVSLLTEFNDKGSRTFDHVCGWATIVSVAAALSLFFATIWGDTLERLLTANSEPVVVDSKFEAVLEHEADSQRSLMLALAGGNRIVNVRFDKLGPPFRDHGGPAGGNVGSIAEYLGSLSPGRMVVLGQAGSGKTFLALSLQAQLLRLYRKNQFTQIPVLVKAASYDLEMTWPKWLAEHLALRYALP